MPALTAPPLARPPPKTLSMAPPMACVTGLFLMKLTMVLIALNALLTTSTRSANKPMTKLMAVPRLSNAWPSTLPITGAMTSRTNVATSLNKANSGLSFSSFSPILVVTFSNADRKPSMIGDRTLPIAGITNCVMKDQMALNVGMTKSRMYPVRA